jgi:hypothetical protein
MTLLSFCCDYLKGGVSEDVSVNSKLVCIQAKSKKYMYYSEKIKPEQLAESLE